MTVEDFQSIAGAGAILFLILAVLRGAGIGLMVYRDATRTQRREQFASHHAISLPPAAQSFAARMEALGFRHVGELQTRLPGMAQPGTTWIYFSADSTVYAELVIMGDVYPAVQFSTRFSDDSLVETAHPVGENMSYPDYHTSRVETSIEAAYEHHQRQAETFSIAHGAPKVMRSIDEVIMFSPIYRKKYMARRSRRTLLRQQVLPFAGDCIAAVGFAVVYLIPAGAASLMVLAVIGIAAFAARIVLATIIPEMLKRA